MTTTIHRRARLLSPDHPAALSQTAGSLLLYWQWLHDYLLTRATPIEQKAFDPLALCASSFWLPSDSS
jgi:hypothetical protein